MSVTQDTKMYIEKRQSTYQFRQRVPNHLLSLFPNKDIRVSLQTKSLKIAKLRANLLSFRLNNLFLKGHLMDVATIKAVINAYIKEATEEYSPLETPRHNALKFIDESGKEYGGQTPQAIDKELEILQELSFSDNAERLEQKAQSIIPRTNISKEFIDSLNSHERHIFNHELIKGEYTVLMEDRAVTLSKFKKPEEEHIVIDNISFKKDFIDTIKGHLGELSNEVINDFKNLSNSVSKSVLFSEAMEQYIEIESVNKNWVQKTKESNHRKLLVALQIMGDKSLSQYDREELETFRSNLLRLPANVNKLPQFRNKTIIEIIDSNMEYQAISRATANEYIVVLSAFFQWAKIRDYTRENYAQSMKVKDDDRKAIDKKPPFESEDIINIFREIKKIKNEKPHLYFITLIGFYNGFRVNEICQLHMEDIKIVDDLWCFDINKNPNSKGEKVKSVKNKPSIRIVPMHPALIEFGLLDYYKKVEKMKEERLFYQLNLGKNGYTKNVEYYFSVLKKRYWANTKKSFHSTRHIFIDKLKKLYGNSEKRKAITGRCYDGDIDNESYGHDQLPKDLIDDISKVTYPEIL